MNLNMETYTILKMSMQKTRPLKNIVILFLMLAYQLSPIVMYGIYHLQIIEKVFLKKVLFLDTEAI